MSESNQLLLRQLGFVKHNSIEDRVGTSTINRVRLHVELIGVVVEVVVNVDGAGITVDDCASFPFIESGVLFIAGDDKNDFRFIILNFGNCTFQSDNLISGLDQDLLNG